MGYRKKLLSLIFTSFVVILVYVFGFCQPEGEYWICRGNSTESVAVVFILFMPIIILISLTLLFLREEVFHLWKKFAIVYLPIVAILLYVTTGESGSGIGLGRIDGEIISWFLSGLFLFVSIIIISIKSWKLRKG